MKKDAPPIAGSNYKINHETLLAEIAKEGLDNFIEREKGMVEWGIRTAYTNLRSKGKLKKY